MDLVDFIEKRRFVGREFLVFLWFESELFDGMIPVEGFGPCELRLEGFITLSEGKEQARLKGTAPSGEPEAHQALRQGKLPVQARIRVTVGELEFAFAFNADTLAVAGVKIPGVVKGEADEQFYDRMYLIEELESLLGRALRQVRRGAPLHGVGRAGAPCPPRLGERRAHHAPRRLRQAPRAHRAARLRRAAAEHAAAVSGARRDDAAAPPRLN